MKNLVRIKVSCEQKVCFDRIINLSQVETIREHRTPDEGEGVQFLMASEREVFIPLLDLSDIQEFVTQMGVDAANKEDVASGMRTRHFIKDDDGCGGYHEEVFCD